MKNCNPIQLKTTSNGLSFQLQPSPKFYPEGGPTIIVSDGTFMVCSYCLSTLADSAAENRGVCVTSGKFEKYRAIEAGDLARLCCEARNALAELEVAG